MQKNRAVNQNFENEKQYLKYITYIFITLLESQ